MGSFSVRVSVSVAGCWFLVACFGERIGNERFWSCFVSVW